MINNLLLFSFLMATVNSTADWFLKAYLDTIALKSPVMLASGVISTSAIEYNTALSYTEEALYFSTNEPDWSRSSIMVTSFREGKFTKPSRVTFGGKDYDAGMYIFPQMDSTCTSVEKI